MLNLLGDPPRRERLAAIPGAAIHLYEKDPRPGRKVGHVNLIAGGGSGPAERSLEDRLREAIELLDG